MDDIDASLGDKKFIGLLKSALWEVNGKKIVSYYTNRDKKEIECLAKIIIIANNIPQSPAFAPLLDRFLVFRFDLSREEILKIAEKEILPQPYKELSFGERKEVFEFMRSLPVEDLSFRVLIKGFEYMLFDKKNWREMLKNEFIK